MSWNHTLDSQSRSAYQRAVAAGQCATLLLVLAGIMMLPVGGESLYLAAIGIGLWYLDALIAAWVLLFESGAGQAGDAG